MPFYLNMEDSVQLSTGFATNQHHLLPPVLTARPILYVHFRATLEILHGMEGGKVLALSASPSTLQMKLHLNSLILYEQAMGFPKSHLNTL